MSLLTVGTVAFDSIESPYGKVENVIGGAATYIAWAASYFTENIRLVSVVGDDFPMNELIAMEDRGIDLKGLKVMVGQKSFYWEGKYHTDLNTRDTLVTDLNVLAEFNPVLPDSYKESSFVMLGNLTPDIQMQVIDQLKTKPKVIALDTMNFWMDTAWDSLMKVLKKIDILIINDEEARQLTNEHSLLRASKKILELGPNYVVIKKGEHGALLFGQEEVFFAPALPLADVFDPTGAGDSFAGGFMGYLASVGNVNFENLKRAVIYGSAMASFCVEKFSLDRLKTITEDDLVERIDWFVDLVHFEV